MEMKYSNDKRVAFNNESHSYFKGENKLTSVTTFISNFKNKFDADFHSERIAKREGRTKKEVLAEWKQKAFKSTEIGTAIHKIFEDYTNNNFCFINDELSFEYNKINDDFLIDFELKKKVSLKFIKDFFISGRLKPIETEYIVYNDLLAGQIDNISIDSKGNYYILDFKTNKEIEKYSYNKKMLGDLSFLNDSSFYHYSLQLSIYKQMLRKYKVSNFFLVHITESEYKFIECENIFKKYEIDFNTFLNKNLHNSK